MKRHICFSRFFLPSAGALLFSGLLALAVDAPGTVRKPADSVNNAALRESPGLRPNQNLLFNGWGITPAGEHITLSDMPLKLILSPDGKFLLAVSGGYNDTGLTIVYTREKQLAQFVPLKKCWNGLAFSKDGKRVLVSGGGSGLIHVFKYANGTATAEAPVRPVPGSKEAFLAAIVVYPGTGKVYVCNEGEHEILVLNESTLALEAQIPVGQHPHTCVLGAGNVNLYVSNWGSRSVSIVDTQKGRRLQDIPVGLRPNDMTLGRDGRLFVACSGDNTVHVIDTKLVEKVTAEASLTRRPSEAAREIISTSLYPDSPEGSAPDAVAVSPDGKTLFVANADNNDVAVINIADVKESRIEGFLPVGWFPTALATSLDGRTLYVANGKGLRSRANFPAQASSPRKLHKGPISDHIARTLEGSISFITRPTLAEMQQFTEQVRRNSPYTPSALHNAPTHSECALPDVRDRACPIKYVLYIIKENRTYDQVLGDFKDAAGRRAGNGDPNLTIYGEKVTPNQHRIAREYVLLDNLFCNGEVSVDGHSWCQAAIATDHKQRPWMASYSGHGIVPGNDDMDTPAAGFLWDLCRRNGVSYRNYGEGAKRVPTANRGTWGNERDMDRVQGWIDDLHAAEQKGDMARFAIMSLGENHTRGTTPGAFTPDACVASNDLGVGRIVEAASRSKFWNQMAIFIIEDDAQNGPDHVDAHRTAGFVISPFCKRGVVDSTFYTTASMIRTMELILGLPPLTQFDAGATPMFNCFQKTSHPTPFVVRAPEVDIVGKNTFKSPFAKQTAKMDFREYDEAPEDELNRILWHTARGMDAPYPTPIHRMLFSY